MVYDGVVEGRFVSRPNRFIANVIIDGEQRVCHVKNTGRCRELLLPGSRVFIQRAENPNRKTEYDLIAVYKNNLLINMDSQAPNRVFGEWAAKSGFFGVPSMIRPECQYKNSRFDFYIESGSRKIFAEVKGVTLEEDGIVMFPDAPTERGVKHLRELMDCAAAGYEAHVFFVAQMERARLFRPNRATHPEFADILAKAAKSGVHVSCVKCRVTPCTLEIDGFIATELEE